jgi:hypothetical protein
VSHELLDAISWAGGVAVAVGVIVWLWICRRFLKDSV